MSKYHFFFGALLLLFGLYQVIDQKETVNDPPPDIAGQALMVLLRDTTGSRDRENRYYLDADWTKRFREQIESYPHGMTLDVYSLSDRNQEADRLELQEMPERVSRINGRWPQVEQEREEILRSNRKIAEIFFGQMDYFSGKGNKDDTYLYPTLDNVAMNLLDDGYFDGPRVLVINSDLIHDDGHKAPELINADYVRLLNQLASRGVRIFLLSGSKDTGLIDALDHRIIWLSQPDDLFRYLNEILQPPK